MNNCSLLIEKGLKNNNKRQIRQQNDFKTIITPKNNKTIIRQ